ADPLTEEVDLAPPARLGVLGRQVRVRDAPFDGVAVAARGHTTDDGAIDAHGLVAQGDRARVVEDEAGQAWPPTLGPPGQERLATDEVGAAVHAHRESEPRFEWRFFGRDVHGPGAVALLQAQPVDGPIAE